jgi:hypothetical protein
MKSLKVLLGFAVIIAAIILSMGLIHLFEIGAISLTIGPAEIKSTHQVGIYPKINSLAIQSQPD